MSIHKELHILKTDDHSEFALWEVAKSENTLIKKEAIFLSHEIGRASCRERV